MVVDNKELEQSMEKEKFPAPVYLENILVELFEDSKKLFLKPLIEVEAAHTLMLVEQGIITEREANALCSAIKGLDHSRIASTFYEGKHEDLFFFLESLIAEACGEDTAGRLHTARSRNDIDVTIYRMRLREDLLSLIRSTMDLRRSFLNIASAHHETLIPAYTHTQPAQPTTLAHYLLSMTEILGRDIERLRRAFELVNQSPLGACAITTTGFPIKRERTAELLGFDGPTVNSYASISSIDYFTEAIGAISVLLINVGRFAQDFLLMATREFGAIYLSDGYVQTSSIMPQKRNPVALEHIRALASKALGQATAVLISVHNTPFGDINDVEDDLQPLIANALRDARRSVSLFAAALSTAIFNTDLLAKRAGSDFITVTELADTIVRIEHLPFKTAHSIVARAVVLSSTYNERNIVYESLQMAAQEIIKRPLSLSSDEVARALDPQQFVRVRNILGGPSPEETRRAMKVEIEKERKDEEWFSKRTEGLSRYRHLLAEKISERAGNF